MIKQVSCVIPVDHKFLDGNMKGIPIAKSQAEQIKERIKHMRSLESLPKEETLKLRRKHVGYVNWPII